MGIIDSATNAIETGKNTLLDSGPAAALSGAVSTVTGAVKSIGSFLQKLTGGAYTSLPLPNPLNAYATYNYIIGIGVLTDEQLNYPDLTYVFGGKIKLICKTAGADPSNRISTAYGKFDFFVDNVVLDSIIGFEEGCNTNVSTIAFDVIEPYSMGMFILAMQQAAQEAGHENFRDAPYVLSVQFRGNKENGTMQNIPNTARFIPFKVNNFEMKVTASGSTYHFTANSWNDFAQTSKVANLKTDTSIKGKTVQEVLQTGEKSLQAVVNKRLQQYKIDKLVEEPDQVIILFPNEIASSATPAASEDNVESSASATASALTTSATGINQKLGVSISKINGTLVQADGECNALGKASLGLDVSRRGESPISKDNQVYDSTSDVYVRGNNTFDVKEGNFKFSQDTDIPTAINQVLLASSYPEGAMSSQGLDANGFRDWWRIDTQVYNISSNANMAKTGVKPKLIVYRVIPYKAHSANLMPPNLRAPGLENVKNTAVKVYNYLYTGKNTDVLKFEILFNNGIDAIMSADDAKRTQDVQTADETGGSFSLDELIQVITTGAAPAKKLGVIPTTVSYSGLRTGTDYRGGGGPETAATRAARVFHDAITNGIDMQMLNLEIVGDPYWIAQSGTGNYSSMTIAENLTEDGSVNYQNGEVHCMVNFRTPIDINQSTGMYNFGTGASAPVIAFSGLYRINKITNTFKDGKFVQVLEGNRVEQQENPAEATASQLFSVIKDAIGDLFKEDPNAMINANLAGENTGTENPEGV